MPWTMTKKVTDPKKRVTDPILLRSLAKRNIPDDEVEFFQDYASPYVAGKRVKEHSPYAKFYRNLNTNEHYAVISQLPMVDADGIKIEVGWEQVADKYVNKNNLFVAVADANSLEITIRNDQPDGRKTNDRVTIAPQIFLDNQEITATNFTLLDDDPLNPNYSHNTLEWDYGICKRRVRIIEGRILGSWVFNENPNGSIRIKYNQSGDYRLKLGQFRVNDDEEIIPLDVFNNPEQYTLSYPISISDTATYYPDAHPETNTVDGITDHVESNITWSSLVAAAGTFAMDDYYTQGFFYIVAGDVSAKWSRLRRSTLGFLINISGVITGITFSIYGPGKADDLGISPNINIYSSSPASNTSLAAGDFDSFGSTAYCDTPITYAGWSTSGYNDFTLNSTGISACPTNGVFNIGVRNANYDVANSAPSWVSGAGSYLQGYFSEKGSGYKPKLVVTYTPVIAPTVTTQAATNVNAISCTGNGNITATGGENCTRRGFCYIAAASGDPTTADSVAYDDGDFGTGAFTKLITGLSPGTQYRVRAYAVNSAGTSYGTTVDVTTSAASAPTVDTDAATDVADDSFTANGEITDDGGGCTRRGFCYIEGEAGDPDTGDSEVHEDGTFTAGVYDLPVTGLSSGTGYRVRAYVVNSTGTVYGSTVQVYTTLAAPTDLAATDGTHTDKIILTWTKPSGTVTGNKIYRDDVLIDTIGDVETYDDDGADAPTITPGAAVASDGTYSARVALSLSGASANNGTTHTYKVVAYNAGGDGLASNEDTGYRGVGSLTYQWQKSAADSDADYSNIDGATSATYNDTDAPNDGEGRYYQCVLAATGAAGQTSAADRGFRMHYLKPRNVWYLVVKNGDGETLSYLPDAWGIHTDYRINELPSLEFNVPVDSAARPYFVDPNEVWLYKDGTLEDIFRIARVAKNRRGATDITVTCQGMGYALTKSIVMSYSATTNTTGHLTAGLALQENPTITLGGVDPTLEKTFAFAYSKGDLWGFVKAVRNVVGGYVYITFDEADPSDRKLWLMSTMGEDKGQQIRINKNLLAVTHETDYIPMFNKLYPQGASGLALTTKTYDHVSATKSADATYGYLTLQERFGAYSGWTGEGDAVPANVHVYKPGGSWVSPTSASGTNWVLPSYAIDGNNGTRTYYPPFSQYTYSSYLILDRAATTCTQIKILLSDRPGHSMEVDVYYSGSWHNVYPLQIPGDEVTISFAEQSITSVRIRFYNWYYPSPTLNTYVNEVYLWSTTGYADDTSNWKQGADEQTLRCAIASYDASAPYVISYTHAAYLIDPPPDRSLIYSTNKDFSSISNVDTLLSAARVHLEDIKTAVVSVSGEMIDLSTQEGREFENLQLGSRVSVIDGELVINEDVHIVRLEYPDIGVHPEKVHPEFGTKVKDIIDFLLD